MAGPVDELPFPNFASSLPIADRASLVGLSDDNVRGQCVAKANEYRRFALAQLSIYNSIAPIHRLPPEILSKIFEGCWTGRKSLRISHVCRQWRSVLLGTTGFWVKAVKCDKFSPDQHTITYLGAILERSAAHLVELSFFRFSESIADCLSNHAGRIVTLKVSLADESDLFALSLSLNSGMPCLRILTIALKDGGDSDNWGYNRRFESLSSPVLPRLTRLTAPPFLFPILGVSSLRHITLKWYRGYSYYGRLGSLECFCETLVACAGNLRSLRLMMVSFNADITTTSPCVVSLPALRYLQITDATNGCSNILSRLSLSNSPQIQIYCTSIDYGGLSKFQSANPDLVFSCISVADRLEICRTAEAVSVHYYAGDKERLCLGLTGPAKHLNLRTDDIIIEIFRDRARVRELIVSGLAGRDVQAVELRAFPHLAHLETSGETTQHVLQQLAHSADPSDNGIEILSPGLETLTVDFHSDPPRNRGVDLGAALRNGNLAVVEADLRDRCTELERVLEHRSQRGTRLTWLEFGCTDESGQTGTSLGDHAQELCMLDPTGPDWVSWRPIVEPLEKLVDGTVVFTGYRFFAS